MDRLDGSRGVVEQTRRPEIVGQVVAKRLELGRKATIDRHHAFGEQCLKRAHPSSCSRALAAAAWPVRAAVSAYQEPR